MNIVKCKFDEKTADLDSVINFKLHSSWKPVIPDVTGILEISKHCDTIIKKNDILKSFQYCDFQKLKVIILCRGFHYNFENIHMSPQITKVVNSTPMDISFKPLGWGHQGVLMISDALTFESPSYQDSKTEDYFHLWIPFWSQLIQNIELQKSKLAIIILGKKSEFIASLVSNSTKCFIHEHPTSKFFDSKNIFEECNEYLESIGKEKINWSFY